MRKQHYWILKRRRRVSFRVNAHPEVFVSNKNFALVNAINIVS